MLSFPALKAAGIDPLLFDGELTPEIEAALAGATHLVVSIAPDETGDPVLNAARPFIAEKMPELAWIGYLSTIGVYGDHGGAWIDEATPRRPVAAASSSRPAAFTISSTTYRIPVRLAIEASLKFWIINQE